MSLRRSVAALLLVVSTLAVSAAPREDPGGRDLGALLRRVIRKVLVLVTNDTDTLSIPHP
jgi:hypothetical protein